MNKMIELTAFFGVSLVTCYEDIVKSSGNIRVGGKWISVQVDDVLPRVFCEILNFKVIENQNIKTYSEFYHLVVNMIVEIINVSHKSTDRYEGHNDSYRSGT